MSHVDFKKCSCRPVEFKKLPCPMSLFFSDRMSHVTKALTTLCRPGDFRGLELFL